jgi:hypothetical protein
MSILRSTGALAQAVQILPGRSLMETETPASNGRSLVNQARYHRLEPEIKDKLGPVVTLYKRFGKLRLIQKNRSARFAQVLAVENQLHLQAAFAF